MEHKIDRIVDKIDKIEETLIKQEVNLARLTTSVEEHVKRSNQLEGIVLPLQRKVNYVEGAIKFITFLGVLAGLLEAILWIRRQ